LKGKLLIVFLALLLASQASAVATYEMVNSDNNVYHAYACVKGGGSETGSIFFWLDIDLGGCVSELFVCWMEGFCGALGIQDVWGITNVTVSPSVLHLGEQLTVTYRIKNYSSTTLNNQGFNIYIKDLASGTIVPNSQSNESITLVGGQELTQSKVYTIDTPDYREKGNYSVVVKLPVLTNDEPSNNTVSDDFTVVSETRAVTVPDINLALVPLIGLIVVLIISLRTKKEE
jgi:hypothetical protein